MKKILIVFGTRPEAIKMAPVVLEFKKHPVDFKTIVCVTAQHREMLDQVLSIYNIIPDYDLNIMKEGQDLYDITSKILLGMKDILISEKPDTVFVHGDTSTSFSTALAAYYQQIPVCHIEAGLRTYNIYSPWPEEMNRQIIGRISKYHFPPTHLSYQNLLREGVEEKNMTVTGNTVIDALSIVLLNIRENDTLQSKLIDTINDSGYLVPNINSGKKFILVTGHRRENFGAGFLSICAALLRIAQAFPEVDIVYPVHLNPNVQVPVRNLLGSTLNIYLIKPLEYTPFIFLLSKAYFVLTDSGGIQEEAPSLGKPVLVMRNTTERPESIIAGTVKLVGSEEDLIYKESIELLQNQESYNKMSTSHNPFGDGMASKRIVEFLKLNL